MILLKWLLLVEGICFVIYLFPPTKVMGESMFPTYKDGEYILSTRIFNVEKIKLGDVMIFKSPYDKERLLIKRVADIYKDKEGKVMSIYFLGDNSEHSYDGRNFGYVLTNDLVSKVINPRRKEE